MGTVNAGLDRPRERGVAEHPLAPPARARARIETGTELASPPGPDVRVAPSRRSFSGSLL